MADSKTALARLAEVCQEKRARLGRVASRRSDWRRALHVTSGVLALISAASITAVIAQLTNSLVVKVFSAVVAFLSGLITLVISAYFDEKETMKIFEGSNKFLSLRDQADLVRDRDDVTEKQAFAALEKLRVSYASYCAEYDHYLPTEFFRRGHGVLDGR
jgi:hypothetical protein